MGVRELLSRAFRKWRAEGIVPLFVAALNRLRHNTKRSWDRRSYQYTPLGRDVIDVNPELITHFLIEGNHPATSYRSEKSFLTKHELSKAHFPIETFLGAIVPGTWDRHRKPHQFDRVYRAIEDHYVRGTDWVETEYVQHMLLLDELYDTSYVPRRIRDCESLYQSMLREGYKPESDPTENVRVNVGRHGELIFNNKEGHHRLALAKILGIDLITVVVIVRHERWEALREEIVAADAIDDLDERARRHLDHPDVKQLHDFDRADRLTGSSFDRLKRFFDRLAGR